MRLFARHAVDDGGGGEPVNEVVDTSTGASSEWNGEMESLAQQDWWGALDPVVRPKVEAGLRAKHSNWQSGFQTKIRAEQANVRATVEPAIRSEYDARITAAEQRAAAAERKANSFTEFFGEGSSQDSAAQEQLAQAQAELERLRGLETEKSAWEQEREALAKERDDLKTWRETREQAEIETEVQRFVAANKDLLENDDAAAMLETLIESKKMDADEAVAKVRRLFERAGASLGTPAAAPPPAPAAPARPDPIDMMSPGDSTNGSIRGPHKEMSLYEAAGIAFKNRRLSG